MNTKSSLLVCTACAWLGRAIETVVAAWKTSCHSCTPMPQGEGKQRFKKYSMMVHGIFRVYFMLSIHSSFSGLFLPDYYFLLSYINYNLVLDTVILAPTWYGRATIRSQRMMIDNHGLLIVRRCAIL